MRLSFGFFFLSLLGGFQKFLGHYLTIYHDTFSSISSGFFRPLRVFNALLIKYPYKIFIEEGI